VATKSNAAYLTILALAAADHEVFDKYNRFAEFWTLTSFALQRTFFISFGRLFDARRDSVSVNRLIDATTSDPSFSRRQHRGIASASYNDQRR